MDIFTGRYLIYNINHLSRTHLARPQPQDDISYHRVRNDTYHGNQPEKEPKLQENDFQRNETYHGNFQEFSDTDYAVSQTRYKIV